MTGVSGVLAAGLLLSGCNLDYIEQKELDMAAELCTKNGGPSRYQTIIHDTDSNERHVRHVHCKDGARFTIGYR